MKPLKFWRDGVNEEYNGKVVILLSILRGMVGLIKSDWEKWLN